MNEMNPATASMYADISAAQLRTVEVHKRYGSFEALTNVSLDIRGGEFLTLLGPSGSGKTTLLMIMAGFEMPTRGRILKNDDDITRRPPERRDFGMVFQGYSLFPHLTVADNVDFPLRIRRLPRTERRRRVTEMLEIVGLSDHGHKKPDTLSGGQQQRVAIARALVFNPEILLLDEPLSALDKNLREQLQNELKRIHREIGTTFVFVTHDQSEALALSSRIAIFRDGRIVQVGDPETVYSRPENRFVAEFLGRINLLPVHNARHDGDRAWMQFGDTWLSAPAGNVNPEGSQVLAVRPEHMWVHRQRPGDADNAISVRVVDSIYHGATTTLTLDTGGNGPELTTTIMNNDAAPAIENGAEIWLSWDRTRGALMPDAEREATNPDNGNSSR